VSNAIPKSTSLALDDSGHTVRVDAQGRLCLTDLWRAAGAEENQRPSQWLRLPGTETLISQLGTETVGLSHSLVETSEGRSGGAWSHYLLALAYAEYLSPAFHLRVLRVYSQATAGQLPPPKPVAALPERVQAAAVMARAVGEVLQLSPQSVAASILDFGRREGGLELPGLAPQLPGVGRSYTATELAAELGTHPSVLGKLIKASGIQDDPTLATKVLLTVNDGTKQVSQFTYNEEGAKRIRAVWAAHLAKPKRRRAKKTPTNEASVTL
jgi:hypothetical protein